jgi:hypothetical protein
METEGNATERAPSSSATSRQRRQPVDAATGHRVSVGHVDDGVCFELGDVGKQYGKPET